MGDQETLATVHRLRMEEHWGKRWADENAFDAGRWPQNEKEWRQTPHGAPWDTNVEMAKFHLSLARKIANALSTPNQETNDAE